MVWSIRGAIKRERITREKFVTSITKFINIVLFRSQVEEIRDQETRNVPLFYIQTDDRQELYLQNTINVESGFSGSNTR